MTLMKCKVLPSAKEVADGFEVIDLDIIPDGYMIIVIEGKLHSCGMWEKVSELKQKGFKTTVKSFWPWSKPKKTIESLEHEIDLRLRAVGIARLLSDKKYSCVKMIGRKFSKASGCFIHSLIWKDGQWR